MIILQEQPNLSEKLRNPKEAFRNEDGAIDLASIMVGIIVIGLIGGVIAATVFAVIPWTQDKAAKEQLESVHNAQNAYMGLTSGDLSTLPAGTKQNSFASSVQLATVGLLAQNKNYCADVSADGKNYTAYSLSSAGKIWAADNKNAEPSVFTGQLPDSCPELKTAAQAAGALADISSPGKGDGTRAATAGTHTGDGSGSYFPANTLWLQGYGTPMTQTLPSPKLDITAWTYTESTRTIAVTFTTDGTFAGIGGSWHAAAHFDISCYNTTTKAFTVYSGRFLAAEMHGGGSWGRNSDTEVVSCPSGTVMSQAYLRQSAVGDFPSGVNSYTYTISGLSEGWVNPAVPQQ